MLLESVSKDRNNNLNFIRFVAAIMVIYCHAYPLSISGGLDELAKLTNNQMNCGSFAVCIFFFFSGFFLNRSVNKGQSAFLFFKARCIRIFPCLVVVVLLCTFVLGSCITEYGLKEYLTNSLTYKYLLNSFFILQHNLPGVFINNVYNSTVNGSLWTLPVEFICYILCWLSWKFGLSNEKVMKYTIPIFFIFYVLVYMLLKGYPLIQSVLRPCGMFYCGMLFDTYRKKIYIKTRYLIVCGVGIVLTACLNCLEFGIILFMPYLLIYMVFGTKKKYNQFAKNHEISYGMYLCGFPIQQTIVMLFGGSMNPILNFVIGVPIAIMMGYILNVLIEKPLLKRLGKI